MKLTFEKKIALPRKVVFEFFQNQENIKLLHEGWPGFRVLKIDGYVRIGNRFTVENRAAGLLPIALTFEHDLFEPPARFGEKLIRGPFRRFYHIHEFEECSDGTIVRDLLDIKMPWYLGGELAMQLMGGAEIRKTFAFRAQAIERLAASGVIGAAKDL